MKAATLLLSALIPCSLAHGESLVNFDQGLSVAAFLRSARQMPAPKTPPAVPSEPNSDLQLECPAPAAKTSTKTDDVLRPPTAGRNFDRGMVEGLMSAAAALSVRSPAQSDLSALVRHFELRREHANAMAERIEALAGAGDNAYLKISLRDIAKDVLAAPQQGYGNITYWQRQVGEQDSVFTRAAERLARLREVVHGDPLGADYMSGQLTGLLPVAAGLSTIHPVYGNIMYWEQHFWTRHGFGSAASSSLMSMAWSARDIRLRIELEEIAKDIASPRRGNGDVHDWVEAVKSQHSIFTRAGERLAKLRGRF